MDNTRLRIKPRSLTLVYFNTNGIPQRPEIHDFLTRHQVDVMLWQETFLKPSKRDPRVSNYLTVRNDRITSPMGGTLIHFKKSLHCVPISPPPLTNIEVSCCLLSLTGHPSVMLVSCYLSPSKLLLRSDIEALLSLGPSVILAGDFNSKNVKWNSHSTNTNGRILDTLVDEFNVDLIAPMTPTRYPPQINYSPEVLDVVILKGVTLRLRSIEVLHELTSDHRPVLMHLGPPPPSPVAAMRSVVNWDLLGESLKSINSPQLDQIPDDIVTADDVNLSIDALTSHLHACVEASSKLVPATRECRGRLPIGVRRLVTEKNRLTRVYDAAPTSDNKTALNRAQHVLKRAVSEFSNHDWGDTLAKLNADRHAYWRMARTLKSDGQTLMPPLRRTPPDPLQSRPPPPAATHAEFLRDFAVEDDEKAECLATSLEMQCTPCLDHVDPVHLATVNREVERRSAVPATDPPPLSLVRAAEVQAILKGIKIRKSPGADGISNRVLKLLSMSLIYLLVSIFNAAISNCIFPAAWKTAVVIGIPKPGKPACEPASYRPISLLSSLGKIYERLLMKRLIAHSLEHKLIPDEQFGFRPRHSCVQQVHRITEHILSGFNHPHSPLRTLAVFLDVAKAFDKVWHEGLIYKLYQLGIPDRLVKILQDFLRDRSFRYRVEGALSAAHPIQAGVPQGSVLSPALFSLFTSDMPHHTNVHLALFADDTALYCSGWNRNFIKHRLQIALSELGAWFQMWGITVNPEKSAAVHFHPSRWAPPRTRLSLFGREIPWTYSTKYLGVILDRRLNFAKHIKSVRDRAAFFMGRLHPMLCTRSKLSLRNKVTLYKTCIRPVMTYASVVFAQSSPLQLHKLQVIQNKFIRRATGARWYQRNVDLHCDLELDSILHFMKESSRCFFDAAPHHKNPLIVEASNYRTTDTPTDQTGSPPLRRRPRDILGDPDDPITAAQAADARQDPSGHPPPNSNRRPRRRGRRLPIRFRPSTN